MSRGTTWCGGRSTLGPARPPNEAPVLLSTPVCMQESEGAVEGDETVEAAACGSHPSSRWNKGKGISSEEVGVRLPRAPGARNKGRATCPPAPDALMRTGDVSVWSLRGDR
ncbi:hypothetical protein NDU88_003534 [Pleurodeles waltl]|uniref:Uncharacterized protein n=1 Tax=Pleurodeles waltl TaxID=8319 RepID=A0AAV7TNU0_PLEWA|nr:hypothetical protein NDU88_003534 [Pleurodeles waltl]